MKYLIKLEDRKNGREALVECSPNMLLEELCLRIKLELHLPCCECHCFRGRGHYYVPDYLDWRGLEDLLGEWSGDPWQEHPWMPSERFRRSTERVRLKYMFTVKGSAINYNQVSDDGIDKVRCTLIDRF